MNLPDRRCTLTVTRNNHTWHYPRSSVAAAVLTVKARKYYQQNGTEWTITPLNAS